MVLSTLLKPIALGVKSMSLTLEQKQSILAARHRTSSEDREFLDIVKRLVMNSMLHGPTKVVQIMAQDDDFCAMVMDCIAYVAAQVDTTNQMEKESRT